MPRVFVWLAIATVIVLLMAAGLGIGLGSMPPDVHVLLAVFSLLVSCMVQVVAFMYVSVTGKAVSQAIHLSNADPAPLRKIRETKRSMAHAVGLVISSIVFVIASGAVYWQSGEWRLLHDIAALVVLALHGMVYIRQFSLIVDHKSTVTKIMGAYAARDAGSAG